MTDLDPAPGTPEHVRLTVPAEADLVQVVRVAVRIVAGRAGCSDDARSRLQAAAGAAFFQLLEPSEHGGTVVITLTALPERMLVELRSTGSMGTAIDHSAVVGLADGHEVSDDGQALRVWAIC